MPSFAGTYELRLFSAGFNLETTSAAITVSAPPPPSQATLTVNAGSVAPELEKAQFVIQCQDTFRAGQPVRFAARHHWTHSGLYLDSRVPTAHVFVTLMQFGL